MPHSRHKTAHKGRGAASNPAGRYEADARELFDDGWDSIETLPDAPTTELRPERARRIISRNQSPDITFSASINPYRGCEHGCVYCFARPSHSYLNLSPGLDFESKIFFKTNAAELLEAEFRRPGYRPTPISLGINTDAYQPAERRLEITRSLLQVMLRYRHPVSLLTKSSLIQRDLDLLGEMARLNLVTASVSLTSLDPALKRQLEPRTASATARLHTIEALAQAGVPTGVMVAPIIPAINEHELEALLQAAAGAGARHAGYVLLRLPWELKEVFRDWLKAHYPQRAQHVMSIIRQSRGGKDYDASWGTRGTGTGAFAELLGQRFRLACKRYGLNQSERVALDCAAFRRPVLAGDQLALDGF